MQKEVAFLVLNDSFLSKGHIHSVLGLLGRGGVVRVVGDVV